MVGPTLPEIIPALLIEHLAVYPHFPLARSIKMNVAFVERKEVRELLQLTRHQAKPYLLMLIAPKDIFEATGTAIYLPWDEVTTDGSIGECLDNI